MVTNVGLWPRGLVRVDWEMDCVAVDIMITSKVLEVIRISQHCQKGVTGHNNLPACVNPMG